MTDRTDKWYQRRLWLRILLYLVGVTSVLLTALTYGALPTWADIILRLPVAIAVLLTFVEEQELSFGNSAWRRWKLNHATFLVLLVAFFASPSYEVLAVVIALVVGPYLAFAAFTAFQASRNLASFRSLFELRETLRRNRKSAAK